MHRLHRAGAALSAAVAFAAWSTPALAQETSPPGETDLDRALREAEAQAPATPAASPSAGRSLQVGSATLRLVDLSLDTLFVLGTSNQNEDEILVLQGGGHDPHKRGFTVQNVELSLAAAVDPYFSAEAHLIYFLTPEGESAFELEEVFVTSTALPWGLQIEAGQFFTEFGRLNPQHPHQWDFQDQPVIHTRLFGPDGLRGPGMRVGWLTPLPWFAEVHLGVQNANGETMASFLASDERFDEASVGGRQFVEQDVRSTGDVLYLARANTSFDLGESLTVVLGASALFGPNATGSHAHTEIWGSDLKVKWRPATHFRGWPFIVVQAEVMARRYLAATQGFDPDGSIAAGIGPNGDEFTAGRDTLWDQGFYAQALWGFWYRWVVGSRVEHARATGDSIDPTTGLDATDTDPLRDRRTRISVVLAWHPTEYSRIRLQFNHDVATHLRHRFRLHEPETSQSVWLGIEFFFGAHAAHAY